MLDRLKVLRYAMGVAAYIVCHPEKVCVTKECRDVNIRLHDILREHAEVQA